MILLKQNKKHIWNLREIPFPGGPSAAVIHSWDFERPQVLAVLGPESAKIRKCPFLDPLLLGHAFYTLLWIW